eukprot:GHUV01026525.1.p1 GENE.GHUV01026525.1~~GHUV01026525.1.p1  ORF type:complete len:163 (+),score=29.86 GHUV01026525.1:307-795(+)
MVSSYMRSKAADTQQLLLGLGAAGALAIVALSAVLYTAASKRRRPAYSKAEWLEAVEEIGTIRGFEDIVEEVAKSGIESSIRPEVWPFLLEVFDHASTYQQRQQQHQIMVRQYQQLLLQCQVTTCTVVPGCVRHCHGNSPSGAVTASCHPHPCRVLHGACVS